MLKGQGRYAVEGTLGTGAGGTVYLAREVETDARVALKTLHAVTPDTIAMLRNEFRALEDLHHRNVLHVGELFEDEGEWFLAMEHVEGVEFLEYVAPPTKGLDVERLRSALRQLSAALVALHRAGIVHRDIKPQNVLVTYEGRVVVLDFGISSRGARTTRDEGITGTALYAAPEQITAESVGPGADWYAVGVMLFRALTGRFPFEGRARKVLEEKVLKPAPSPREFASDLPDDLVALTVGLLETDPENRPPEEDIQRRLGVTTVHPPSGTHRIALVGRDAETAALFDAVASVRMCGATTVLVHGQSGVGKSLLVKTFVERLALRDTGLVYLPSRCYERESVPFRAFGGAIDALVDLLGTVDEALLERHLTPYAGLLPRIFPELARIDAIASRADGLIVNDPKEARRRSFEALRGLLTGIARERTLVLVIDDLQWADGDSHQLIDALLRPPTSVPMLTIATLRDAGDALARDVAQSIPGIVRLLPVGRLPREDAVALVLDILAGSDVPPVREELDALFGETGGHPMFLAELALQRLSGRVGAHMGLDETLLARAARIDAPGRRLLELVCLAGQPIPQRIASLASGVVGGSLLGALSVLRSEHLVHVGRAGAEPLLDAYHARIREAVVGALSADARREHHGKLARAMEASASTIEPWVIAEHWLEHGERARAATLLREGAMQAKATLAFDQVARCLVRAIELSPPEDHCVLEEALAEAWTNGGRWSEAARLRLKLAERAEGARALSLRTMAAEQLLCSGHFDEGAQLLYQVLRSVATFVPMGPIATILALLFARLALRIRGHAFTPRKTELLPDEAIRIDALASAGAGLGMSDNVRGSYFQARALLRALDSGDATRILRALSMEACFSAAGGDANAPRTEAILERVQLLAAEVDSPFGRAMVAFATGYFHFFRCAWPETRWELLAAARVLAEECIGETYAITSARTLAFRSLMYLGEYTELGERIREALRQHDEVNDVNGITSLRGGSLSWVHLVEDDVTMAANDLDAIRPMLPRSRFVAQNYYYLNSRAHLELYRGDAEAAHAGIEGRWGALRRSLLLRVDVIRVMALELRGKAALAAAMERQGAERDGAIRKANASAAALRAMGYRCAEALAAMLTSGIDALAGDAAKAAAGAAEAETSFDACSMPAHASAARWQRGAIVGGSAGAVLISEARAALAERAVKRPDAFVRVLAPFART